MRVAICSVGTELTVGEITDTNAVWLSRRLVEVGADVAWHVSVGDVHERVVETLRWLVERCDAVVVGGGLGPTPDDLTREAVAEVVGVPLERREELVAAIRERFASRRRDMPASNLRQADLPAGAVAFAPVGTAPGFSVEVPRGRGQRCVVYALPGVPFELQAMAERDMLPDLLRRGGRGASITRVVHVTGMPESRVAELLAPLLDRLAGTGEASVAFLASPDSIRVRITVAAPTSEEARRRSEPLVQEVLERLGEVVAGVDEQRLEEAVARLLRRAELTVATAESCTAGGVAARLSRVPGASDFLVGALAAYQTPVKTRVLGVPVAVLDEHGPVSVPTAEAMAQRARTVFSSDLGLSVVCVAGPTGQGGQPVGTVIWALASDDGVQARELRMVGDRVAIQARAGAAALEGLRRHLLHAPAPASPAAPHSPSSATGTG